MEIPAPRRGPHWHIVLLTGVIVLLSRLRPTSGGRGSDLNGVGSDSIMDIGNNSITAVRPGDSAKLACPLPPELYGTKLSWFRKKDTQLLATGEVMFTNDQRFFVSHSRHNHASGARHSQVWFLHLLNVTSEDEGQYECQTSNHPHQSLYTYLKVANTYAEISGPPVRAVASGSLLRLTCSIKDMVEPPSFVFWYQGKNMINYDKNRGVHVSKGRDYSVLTVNEVTDSHAGNYTCTPSNAAPASVQVHVVVESTEAGGRSDPARQHDKQLGLLSVKSASCAGPRDPLTRTLAATLLIHFILHHLLPSMPNVGFQHSL